MKLTAHELAVIADTLTHSLAVSNWNGYYTAKSRENGKKVASQRWECLETGFTTNAGNLTQYQRAKGIDTSKRIKLD